MHRNVSIPVPGPAGSSSAGVLPELGDLCVIRPEPGSRDLSNGTDAILVSGSHVGRQLPHGNTPAWGSAYFCLPEDPPPAQH